MTLESNPIDWPARIGDAADLLAPTEGGRAAWHRHDQARSRALYGPPPEAMWLVQAKVRGERRFGPGGMARRRGLRLLRGLSRVSIVRFWRNASPRRVTVVGRHRVSGRYLSLILEARHLFDFSVRLVRSPFVIAQHWEHPCQRFAYGRDREAADAVMAALTAHQATLAHSDQGSAMGSMSHLYLKLSSPSGLETLRQRFPEAGLDVEASSQFASLPWPDEPGFQTEDGERLSLELDTELIYLAFSSSADAFQFTHCQGGRTLRHLQHGMQIEQGLWEQVRGDAEAWEAEAFFGASTRKSVEEMDLDSDWCRRARQLFDGGQLLEGETFPFVDARESARAAAEHYQLSGWLQAPPLQQVQVATPKGAKPWWQFW